MYAMQDLKQVIEKITTQVDERGIVNVLELKPIFKQYSGKDWQNFLKLKNEKPESIILFQNEQLKVLLKYWNENKKTKNQCVYPDSSRF